MNCPGALLLTDGKGSALHIRGTTLTFTSISCSLEPEMIPAKGETPPLRACQLRRLRRDALAVRPSHLLLRHIDVVGREIALRPLIHVCVSRLEMPRKALGIEQAGLQPISRQFIFDRR